MLVLVWSPGRIAFTWWKLMGLIIKQINKQKNIPAVISRIALFLESFCSLLFHVCFFTRQFLRFVVSVALACQLSSKSSCGIAIMNAATLLNAQGSLVCATALRWQLVSPGQSSDDVWLDRVVPTVSDLTGHGVQMAPTRTETSVRLDNFDMRIGSGLDQEVKVISKNHNNETKPAVPFSKISVNILAICQLFLLIS